MKIDEAYAELTIVQDLIPMGNSNRPRTHLAPTRITIHNTDNADPGANAAAHAKYQKGADAQMRKVSWHFTVDDKAVYQSLPTNEVGWHAGSAAGNGSSLGIEICMNAGMDDAAAYEKAALLTAVLAFQHAIAVPSGIVQHNHWTGKHCPRVLRDNPAGWADFLARVRTLASALEEVTTPGLGNIGSHHEGESAASTATNMFVVIASDGLNLRAGPGVKFDVRSSLPFGTPVRKLSSSGDWALVDVSGDGGADGFVHAAFLSGT